MKRAVAWARVSLVALAGCGYHAVHGGGAAPERLSVVLASTNVPDAVASDEVVAGVREELARAGALAGGDSYPRCEVEVLRADETSDGIAAVRGDAAQGGALQPTARATRIGVVARAWVVRAKDAPRERDTGDVRALDEAATAPDARAASFQYSDTLRAAARRAGRNLGAHVVGLPATTE